MAIVANLVSSTLSRSSGGYQHNVDYLVTGPGSLLDAINAVGVPHGTQSSEIPGIYALDFNARTEADDPEVKRVTVGYRLPQQTTSDQDPPPPVSSGGTVSVGARLQPVTRSLDFAGNQITTEHTYVETDPSGNTTRNELVTQPAEVEALIPTTVLAVTRTESDSPLTFAKDFVGFLNNSTFAGEATRKWLCTAIDGVSDDGGNTYETTYEFEFRNDGWDVEVVHIDPQTNKPVSPITVGVELKTFTIYGTANFGALNLGV